MRAYLARQTTRKAMRRWQYLYNLRHDRINIFWYIKELVVVRMRARRRQNDAERTNIELHLRWWNSSYFNSYIFRRTKVSCSGGSDFLLWSDPTATRSEEEPSTATGSFVSMTVAHRWTKFYCSQRGSIRLSINQKNLVRRVWPRPLYNSPSILLNRNV